jgi:hypothetical protein
MGNGLGERPGIAGMVDAIAFLAYAALVARARWLVSPGAMREGPTLAVIMVPPPRPG